MDNPDTPVVTDDGRMLQPQGHGGIWFETEPDDPWGKYVWRSQKFVGDPLELPVLGESAELGAGLKGLPDYCAQEVERRLASIDLVAESTQEGLGRRMCVFTHTPEDIGKDNYFSYAVWYSNSWPLHSPDKVISEIENFGIPEVFSIPGTGLPRDCVAMIKSKGTPVIYASQIEATMEPELRTACLRAAYSRQVFVNITGNSGEK
ncbi:hypothetical protein LA329_02565 [Corynebacterium falsenii]|uniref:hypothetical protein n=1 Tax=Corynebacterium falsenii TaxID=108486 RepID=UPI001CCA21D1|nr:hypothetical protein [Corynebacterium falsenii]UBI07207.1 hypothetical protein LA329_02565 [Corynebacterium falsenii]